MEVKWLAIMTIGMVAVVSISGVYVEKQKAKAIIACYEAAKTNHTVKCDKVGQ